MYQNLVIFCLLFNCIYLGSCTSVPFITPCKAADSACITKSAQAAVSTFVAGIPELGVEKLDPIVIKHPINASASGLTLILNNLVTTGMSSCTVENAHRDVAKSKMGTRILCDTVMSQGQYDMEGKLLIINVSGKGKINVVLRKLVIDVDGNMGEKKGKDGKTYWDIKSFTHTFELKDKADLKFEDLFAGNEVLGRAANEVIESNSNEIITEIGAPVIKALITKVVGQIKKFFNNVPPEDLALD
ncbi:unnamed protein product [Diatraea saccharalis]|uniref:Uncharacterized protein n=1 Tax=Diatraea saccharalis TaxID=40085 RepID=A0A9P0C925_9NEOP|nr:unnamed protein product [Diatraea saccharalis]